MADILSWPQCVNKKGTHLVLIQEYIIFICLNSWSGVFHFKLVLRFHTRTHRTVSSMISSWIHVWPDAARSHLWLWGGTSLVQKLVPSQFIVNWATGSEFNGILTRNFNLKIKMFPLKASSAKCCEFFYVSVSWNAAFYITVTSKWRRMRLKSPASRLFAQPFIWAMIKENIKAPRRWPLCGEFTGDRWIPRTNGQ